MKAYFSFLGVGLVLGLYTEVQLKLVAGIKPKGFIVVLFAYPLFLTFFYATSRIINRLVASSWKADVVHYLVVGAIGLAIEWTWLGNGPGSNAWQLGMWAMWTTWGFGPRVLTRDSGVLVQGRKRFWSAFITVAILLSATVLIVTNPKFKLVVSVTALSASYLVWSVWLLILGWRSRHGRNMQLETSA